MSENLESVARAACEAFSDFMDNGDEDKGAFDRMVGAMDALSAALPASKSEPASPLHGGNVKVYRRWQIRGSGISGTVTDSTVSDDIPVYHWFEDEARPGSMRSGYTDLDVLLDDVQALYPDAGIERQWSE